MIRHIVLFRLAATDDVQRRDDAHGIAERLQPRSASRLYDGIPCAVRRAEALVNAGVKGERSAVSRVQAVTFSGLDAALVALLEKSAQS